MINKRRKKFLLVMGAMVALLPSAAPSIYKTYVEHRFHTFLNLRGIAGQAKSKESRCLGATSEWIRLLPILRSKLTGSYPYLDQLEDPKGKSYMEFAYRHGYWFNYCKLVQIDGTQQIAFWSLKQNNWHLGHFDFWNGKNIWHDSTLAGAVQKAQPTNYFPELLPVMKKVLNSNQVTPESFGRSGWADAVIADGVPARTFEYPMSVFKTCDFEAADLNGDGANEILVHLNVAGGVTGNHFIYILQKQKQTWRIIGEFLGTQLALVRTKSGFATIKSDVRHNLAKYIEGTYCFHDGSYRLTAAQERSPKEDDR